MRLTLSLVGLAACGGSLRPRAGDNLPPTAVAGDDIAVGIGESVLFDGGGSFDDDGDIRSYVWTFGDGTSEARGVTAEHAFAASGRFVVTLQVTDNGRASGWDDLIVKVAEVPTEAVLRITPEAPRTGQVITFDGLGSRSGGGREIAGFTWYFGDARSAQGAVVEHAYDYAGTYWLRLVVETDDGETTEAAMDLRVLPLDVAGVFDLRATPSTFSCAKYNAPFRETVMTLGTADSGTLPMTSLWGHIYQGNLSGQEFAVSASYSGTTGGGCIDAPVQATLTGAFDGADAFTGTYVAYYDLAPPCQCSAVYAVEGTRR